MSVRDSEARSPSSPYLPMTPSMAGFSSTNAVVRSIVLLFSVPCLTNKSSTAGATFVPTMSRYFSYCPSTSRMTRSLPCCSGVSCLNAASNVLTFSIAPAPESSFTSAATALACLLVDFSASSAASATAFDFVAAVVCSAFSDACIPRSLSAACPRRLVAPVAFSSPGTYVLIVCAVSTTDSVISMKRFASHFAASPISRSRAPNTSPITDATFNDVDAIVESSGMSGVMIFPSAANATLPRSETVSPSVSIAATVCSSMMIPSEFAFSVRSVNSFVRTGRSSAPDLPNRSVAAFVRSIGSSIAPTFCARIANCSSGLRRLKSADAMPSESSALTALLSSPASRFWSMLTPDVIVPSSTPTCPPAYLNCCSAVVERPVFADRSVISPPKSMSALPIRMTSVNANIATNDAAAAFAAVPSPPMTFWYRPPCCAAPAVSAASFFIAADASMPVLFAFSSASVSVALTRRASASVSFDAPPIFSMTAAIFAASSMTFAPENRSEMLLMLFCVFSASYDASTNFPSSLSSSL